MKRRMVVLMLAVAVCGALLASLLAACAETDSGSDVHNISMHVSYEDRDPQINDSGRVVWEGWDGNDWEIFLYDGGDPVNISNRDGYDDYRPQINNHDLVVWHGWDGNDSEIYLYDGTLNNISKRDGDPDSGPQINASGSVVWQGIYSPGWDEVPEEWVTLPPPDGEVFYYGDAPQGRISERVGSDRRPQINDSGLVVWEGWDGSDSEILLYDGGRWENISKRPGYEDRDPRINGSGSVVWWGYHLGHNIKDREIFLYDGGRWENISKRPGYEDISPRINGSGSVVWWGYDGSDSEIFLYKGGDWENISKRPGYEDISPRINASGLVVWTGYDGSDWEIFLYDPDEENPEPHNISNSDRDDKWPEINDSGLVVWCGSYDPIASEIYLYDGR